MLEGLLTLDRAASVPLPDQIYRGVRDAVRAGRLSAGAALPSSRRLAETLAVSRNTVTAAYELLAAEGVIEVRRGAAPRVCGHGRDPVAAAALSDVTPAVGLSARGKDLSRLPWAAPDRARAKRLEPGTPAIDVFPRDEWARALRRAARRPDRREVLYAQTSGLDRLRAALAVYLASERGVRAEPSQILVTPSTQASLFLLATCLADPGETVWLEDPGYLGARAAFLGAGLTIVPMPVDDQGADPSAMAGAPAPRLVYVTPSHQYPTGVTMPLARRLAVLEQARHAGGLVVEDDYDSEFLFEGRPVAALQGLSGGGEAVYLGTFAKSLLPGLRVAYMVVPAQLAPDLAAAQRAAGLYANVATQGALAEFLETGRYRAHVKRIRTVYRARGLAMAEALRRAVGNLGQVADPTGGVQLTLRFDASRDDVAIAEALQARGFGVAALSTYALATDAPASPVSGLVIGFADATDTDVAEIARAVAAALAVTE